jgi:hypothetical protein
MASKKRLTNVQLFKQLMEISQYGAMAQMVIIHAVRSYVATVSELDGKPVGWSDFIVWESWQGCCRELKEKMDSFYSV